MDRIGCSQGMVGVYAKSSENSVHFGISFVIQVLNKCLPKAVRRCEHIQLITPHASSDMHKIDSEI